MQCPTAFTLTQLVNNEDSVHFSIIEKNSSMKWVERSSIDEKLDEIVKKIFNHESCYIQFYGNSGSGKTATLCRLYQLIKQKVADLSLKNDKLTTKNKEDANISSKNDIVENKLFKKFFLLSRFVALTECSIFANELFRNIFLKV